jgi:hypothetical protein
MDKTTWIRSATLTLIVQYGLWFPTRAAKKLYDRYGYKGVSRDLAKQNKKLSKDERISLREALSKQLRLEREAD